MAIIEIDNLYCKLVDSVPEARAILNEALAVQIQGSYFSPSYQSGLWDGYKRFYSLQSSKFPAGLLSLAVEALNKEGIKPELVDNRQGFEVTVPSKIKLRHSELGQITLRDYQYDSVVNALTATRGVINVATNGGKTEIAAGIIQCMINSKVLQSTDRILFFTHSKEIFLQSHKRLQERLGIPVGKIGDGKWEDLPITVVMIPTVARYMKDPKNKNAVPKNMDPAKYKEMHTKVKALLKSCVAYLADEAHHSASDTWYDLFMKLTNAYYRFGLTGTVDESDQVNVKRLMGCTGKIVMRISNKYLIDNGYSAKPTIHMIDYGASNLAKRYDLGWDYHEARRHAIIHCNERNRAFASVIAERVNSGSQVLIVVNETEHGEVIQSLLEEKGLKPVLSHGKRTTKFRQSALDSLKSGNLRVLIATSILDEGVDVPTLNCIFLMAGGKSLRQSLQRIGRGLRVKADGSGVDIYDALDYHNEHLAEHTLERYNVYMEEEFDIVKLSIKGEG